MSTRSPQPPSVRAGRFTERSTFTHERSEFVNPRVWDVVNVSAMRDALGPDAHVSAGKWAAVARAIELLASAGLIPLEDPHAVISTMDEFSKLPEGTLLVSAKGDVLKVGHIDNDLQFFRANGFSFPLLHSHIDEYLPATISSNECQHQQRTDS